MQTAPAVPQAPLVLPGLQVLFSQQPFGQLAVVQIQSPFWHSVPAGHWTQATPAVPQCWVLLVWQVLFWQQPCGQLVALHIQEPLTHAWPFAHALPQVPQFSTSVWRFLHTPPQQAWP